VSEQQPRLMARIGAAARRAEVDPVVFFVSGGLALAIVAYGVLLPEQAGTLFSTVQRWVVSTFGWYYVGLVAFFLVFALVLAFSRFGEIRLGPDDSEPDYSYLSWFSMLFSAGMGIGLMFFGVAEPITHFAHPPSDEIPAQSLEAARESMRITFLHWGVHAWAIYIVVGLALALFAFRYNLPLTIRSALYPIIGERIYGPIGNIVDIFAVLGTLFGAATSLGLGAMQVNAGFGYILGIPEATFVQLILIAAITGMATVSVVLGLDAGIRRLSILNLWLALALIGFVIVAGPTLFLLSTFMQNTGSYISGIVDLSFRLWAYEGNEWMGSWTLFYWGWWMAWSPFVGMFIARISRGRTVREFVVGVMVVPAAFTFLWVTVFGDTALHMVLKQGMTELVAIVDESVPVALFAMLERLPLAAITTVLATTLVITFFVTSSDSASLVVVMLTSGGTADPPTWQRVFWAVAEGLVAAVLLLAGGLSALQTASIASALPFTVVLIAVCVGLWRALSDDHTGRHPHGVPLPAVPVQGSSANWKDRLAHLVRSYDRVQVERFLRDTVRPALQTVAEELREHNLEATLKHDEDAEELHVQEAGGVEFTYTVRMRGHKPATFAFAEAPDERNALPRDWFAEASNSSTRERYDVMGLTREQVIADFLAHYGGHVNVRYRVH